MQEKLLVTQVEDAHFEQNSDKSTAKSWQLSSCDETFSG